MYDPAPEPPYIPVPRPVLPVDRLAALAEVVICSGFPSQIVLIVILRGFGLHMTAADGRLSPPFVFTVSLLDAAWRKPVEATLPELEKKLAQELPEIKPKVTLR